MQLHVTDGLTVKKLKEIIADWPDENESGEDTEVWASDGKGTSSQVKTVWPLNDGDMLFDHE